MPEKYVAMHGYRHGFVVAPLIRSENVNNMKIPALGILKADKFGKA
jgi:hypothetical protein